MAQYCLDWQTGQPRHFPAGTYYEQTSTETGQLELNSLGLMYRVWNMYRDGAKMMDWDEHDRRLVGMMDGPPQPVNRLDPIIRHVWGLTEWQIVGAERAGD